MPSYVVGKEEMTFDRIVYLSPEGLDTNDGLTEATPMKTVSAASALAWAGGANSALVYLPGEYHFSANTYNTTSSYFFTWNLSHIGQGRDTVFYCDYNTTVGARDTHIAFGGNWQYFYRMWFKITTKNNTSYSNAIAGWTIDGRFYNCCFENIGIYNWSLIYYNSSSQNVSFQNCILRCNAKATTSYSGGIRYFYENLMDWSYTQPVAYRRNVLVRAIADDDIETGTADDLVVDENAIIGLHDGGNYTWSLAYRYLFISAADPDLVWAVRDGVFTQISTNWNSLTDEEQQTAIDSVDIGEKISGTEILDNLIALGEIKIVVYAEFAQSNNVDLRMMAIPHDLTVVPTGLILIDIFTSIQKIVPEGNYESAISEGKILFAFTNDNQTYQIFVNGQWISIDLDEITTRGMTGDEVSVLVEADYREFLAGKEGFGVIYCFTQERYADALKINQLNVTGNLLGTWRKAVKGTDYTYGYAGNSTLKLKILTSNSYKINFQGRS